MILLADSEDPDQTLLEDAQADMGLRCLHMSEDMSHVVPKTIFDMRRPL